MSLAIRLPLFCIISDPMFPPHHYCRFRHFPIFARLTACLIIASPAAFIYYFEPFAFISPVFAVVIFARCQRRHYYATIFDAVIFAADAAMPMSYFRDMPDVSMPCLMLFYFPDA